MHIKVWDPICHIFAHLIEKIDLTAKVIKFCQEVSTSCQIFKECCVVFSFLSCLYECDGWVYNQYYTPIRLYCRSVAAAAAAASNGVGSGGGGGVGVDLSDTSSSVGGSLNDSLAASKYKTALCHAFQKNNRCANGDNCR